MTSRELLYPHSHSLCYSSLNETTGSVIDIQDSTPDISCELVVSESLRNASLPPRHSDIYITDVYNVSEQADSSSRSASKISRDSISLFKQVREVTGEFLEPSLLLQPQTASYSDSTDSLSSLLTTRGRLQLDVCVEYVVTQSAAIGGGTINELITVGCSQVHKSTSAGKQLHSSGGLGDMSSSGGISESWLQPPPPPAVSRQQARFSLASTSSGSSIASSASALVRVTKQTSAQQQSPPSPPALSNERISELRDKWVNSREVWRLLDYVDHCLSSSKLQSAPVTPPPWSQSLEQIDEVSTPTNSSRRAPKVKFEDRQQQHVTPRKRQRKTPAVAATNGHDIPAVTPALSVTSDSCYNSGDRVFAKWTDRKFYAATLMDRHTDGRWTVDFYDGDRRTVSEENLLLADETAMIGLRVYADNGDDNFTLGIVTGCDPDVNGRSRYSVARDDCDICVPAEQILLTESQARQVRSRSARSYNGSVSSGSIISDSEALTPGGRATRSRTRALARDSPVPSSSGTQQRRTAGAEHSTACNAACIASDSEDDSAAGCGAATGNGLEMDVPGLEAETAAAYDGCGRIKGKTVAGKMRFGMGCPEDIAALGPLPPTGCQPFKALHVVLSCVRPSVGGETLASAGGSETGSCSSNSENYRFFTLPCVKSRLQEQLEAGGAVVYARFEELPSRLYKQACLISNRPSRSARYVLCLAAGVRPVCHEWVIRCCTVGSLVAPQELPCGWSLERERFISTFDRPLNGRPLRRKLVIVAASTEPGIEPGFASFWTRVLELAEANVRPLAAATDSEFSRALCVLCECGYRDERTECAMQRGVPLVTPTWLIQTLIHGELREFHRLPCYRPDYFDSD